MEWKNEIVVYLPGIFLFILGLALKKFPPEKINPWIGFRTEFSMKNQQTWNEGNRYAASCMLISALANLLFVAYLQPRYAEHEVIRYSAILLIVLLIISVIATEVHLHKVFDKDGNRWLE
ncbi:MAG: SdpI family protein [Bacteroidia bacterium]|nr:SdpI family protein [Bacteroidia bacterium]